MCGLAGLWTTDGSSADPGLLEPMLDRLAHRGPDGRGAWSEGRVALGHVRLAVLDPGPRGAQPFHGADGVLIYNGEVYNFRELRRELEADGVAFRTNTDTEVVLWALRRWGPGRAIPRFNGMFAFAWFDRAARALWLARDRLGIKPLYLARPAGGLAFASEPKALLAHPGVPCRPDRATLARHLLARLPRVELERTAFEGIAALRPGSFLRVDGAGEARTVWFDFVRDLDVERLLANGRRPPPAFVDELHGRVRESTALHLVSDVPLAATCSGGVDSSFVAAAARASRPDLAAYVANVTGAAPEGDKAERVGRVLGMEVRRVEIDRPSFLRAWPDATWFADQPLAIGPNVPLLRIAERCRRDGVKVLLSGEGSDELFGGYPWQARTWRAWRARRLRSCLPFARPYPPPDVLAQDPFGRFPRVADPEGMLQLRCLVPDEQVLHDAALLDKLAPVRPEEDRAFLAHVLDDMTWFLQAMLLHSDRMGMAHGVETRVPFVESGLIDFAAHLPRRAKLHRGSGKWALKEAAARDLPRAITHQPKEHFAVPYLRFLAAEPLLENGAAAELLGWTAEETRGLRARLRAHPQAAFRVLALELWARVFLRGESRADLGERLAAE